MRTFVARLASEAPRVIGLVAQQIAVLVVLLVARRYGGPGTLPVYQYSQAVYLLPYAVGAVPIATAMFPRLAKTLDDPACFAAWCRHSTGLVASFGFAGGVLLATQARAAEDVFATINPVPGMREGLLAMAPGLAAYALIYHLTRVLYALSASRAVVVGTSTGWIVVGVGSFVARPVQRGRGQPRGDDDGEPRPGPVRGHDPRRGDSSLLPCAPAA
ncbi:lipid II flippase MurJ [Nanchangia anserum]|uniref:lipid II flippase MurJ n=1 Tax=Nanchangia anserum TaxID=2692125 RepID=UPI0022340029|nr:lipid II flippase MurJ [Nanchangia anserum]